MSRLNSFKSIFLTDFFFREIKSEDSTEGDMKEIMKYIFEKIPESIQLPIPASTILRTQEQNLLVTNKDRACILLKSSHKLYQDFKIPDAEYCSLAVHKELYYGKSDGTITSINIPEGNVCFSIKIHEGPVSILAIYDDKLYSASKGKVVVCDTKGENHQTLITCEKSVRCLSALNDIVAIGHDSLTIISGSTYHINTKSPVTAVLCTENSVVAGMEIGLIEVYSLQDRQVIFRFKGHKGRVIQVLVYKISYITVGTDKIIRVWNPKGQQKKLTGHNTDINNLLLEEDRILIAGANNKIMSWAIPDFEDIDIIENINPVKEVKIVGKYLALVIENKSVSIWDRKNFNNIIELEQKGIKSIEVSANEEYLFGLSGKMLTRWKLDGFIENHYDLEIEATAFLCTDEEILIGHYDGSIQTYDAANPDFKFESLSTHSSSITCLCKCKNILFSSSKTSCIVAYKYENESYTELQGHESAVIAFSKTQQENYLISASSSSVRVWSVKNLICVRNLYISNTIHSLSQSDNLLYIGSAKQTTVVDQKSWSEVSVFATKAHSILVDEGQIFKVFCNKVEISENPMTTDNLAVYGPNKRHYDFLFYLSNIIKGGKVNFDKKMDQYFFSYYKINIAHIYTFFNLSEILKLSLQNNTPFAMTSRRETPLSLSIAKDYQTCITVILTNLATRIAQNPYCLARIENNLIELNIRGDKGLENFYDALLYQDKSPYLPNYCSKSCTLPDLKFSKSFESKALDCESVDHQPVFYYHSRAKISTTGSSKSLEFLKSLTICPNDQVFKSSFVDILLQQKWQDVFPYLYIQAILYLIYMIMLIAYTALYLDGKFTLAPIFVVNMAFLIYTIVQMFAGGILFWQDYWNYLDLIRSALVIAFCIMMFSSEGTEEEHRGLLVVINMISWMRGINYFRLFTRTRVMVNLIKEVVKDMLSFLIIFFYSTLAFAFIYFALAEADSEDLPLFIIDSYKLNLSDYDTTDYSLLDYIVFLFATMINTIIMLNLLICILFETYNRVKENLSINDRKELAQLVLEGEINMIRFRDRKEKMYLHAAVGNMLEEEADPVEEKLLEICYGVNEVVRCAKDIKECNFETREKVRNLEEMASHMRISLKAIEGKLNNYGK